MENIHALTEVKYETSPAFLSLNKKPEGGYELLVRSQNSDQVSKIDLSAEQLEDLSNDIISEIYPE
jgi:hypothetical protein